MPAVRSYRFANKVWRSLRRVHRRHRSAAPTSRHMNMSAAPLVRQPPSSAVPCSAPVRPCCPGWTSSLTSTYDVTKRCRRRRTMTVGVSTTVCRPPTLALSRWRCPSLNCRPQPCFHLLVWKELVSLEPAEASARSRGDVWLSHPSASDVSNKNLNPNFTLT